MEQCRRTFPSRRPLPALCTDGLLVHGSNCSLSSKVPVGAMFTSTPGRPLALRGPLCITVDVMFPGFYCFSCSEGRQLYIACALTLVQPPVAPQVRHDAPCTRAPAEAPSSRDSAPTRGIVGGVQRWVGWLRLLPFDPSPFWNCQGGSVRGGFECWPMKAPLPTQE